MLHQNVIIVSCPSSDDIIVKYHGIKSMRLLYSVYCALRYITLGCDRPIFLRSSFVSLTFETSCIVSHVAL